MRVMLEAIYRPEAAIQAESLRRTGPKGYNRLLIQLVDICLTLDGNSVVV